MRRRSLSSRLIPAGVAIAAVISAVILTWYRSLAWAEPALTIKMIVPNAPGGGIDSAARLLARQIGQTHQATVIVENRPGAGGVVGTEDVARATPDGNTLLFDAGNLIVNGQVRAAHYNPLTSFEPICNLIAAPNLIVVNGSSPFGALADLVNAARAKPGELTLASSGPATALQIEFEKFKRAANINMTFVPYRGTAPAVEALLGGHVTSAIAGISVVEEQLNAGTLRALAAGTRIETLPGVPTLAESGYGSAAYEGWEGLFAPAGTPKEKLAQLAEWFTAATRTSEVKPRLIAQGLFPADICGADFAAFLRKEYDDTGRIVREANIKAE